MIATPRTTDWSNTNRTADNTEGVINRDRFTAGQEHAITSISASFDTTASEVLELFGLDKKVGEMDLTDTAVLNLTTNIFTFAGHGLSDTDKVVFHTNGGTAPTNLTSGNTYFVVGVSGDDFQLALTSGGAAIDVAGTQSALADEALVIPLSKNWQIYDHLELDFSTPLQGASSCPLILKVPAVTGIQSMINVAGFSS